MTIRETFQNSGNKYVVLRDEDLGTLDEQFKTLREKIASGEYEMVARRIGEIDDEGRRDQTELIVTIKPARNNVDSSILSMQFGFDHDYRYQCALDETIYYGGVGTRFTIQTADVSYSYGPQERTLPEKASSFLRDVRDMACDQLAPAEWAAHKKKMYAEEAGEAQQAADRKFQIKNSLKF